MEKLNVPALRKRVALQRQTMNLKRVPRPGGVLVTGWSKAPLHG